MPQHEPEDSQALRDLNNNRPDDHFGGLTFNEINRLTFETYEEDSPLKFNFPISNETLDQLPYFRLTEEFLKILQRDGSIKLTPLGALPRKTLTELYGHKLIIEEGIEKGIVKLAREINSAVLSTLHHNTRLAGLVRKEKGKLFLTKTGSKLLTSRDRNGLFLETLRTFTEKLPWSNLDGYAPLPIGNMGWGFSIHMLLQDGDTAREGRYYALKYIKAFPDLVEAYPPREYSFPKDDVLKCYYLRCFERFLEWWGFVRRTREARSFLERDLTQFMATPAVRAIFRFED
jgi:hypothetical protein